MTYKAFISYSHAKDARQARRIHQALSRFATPWYKRRRIRLFLDDANLPATPSLWKSIEQALSESEYLIFLASPTSASSDWCAKEISYWLTHKSHSTIILVLLSGAINWDPKTRDFDWSNTSSLPKVLQGVFSDQPRYIDLSQYDPDNTFTDAHTRNKLADIISVLLDTPKDDLIGEDLRLYKRALRHAWGAVFILFTASLIATWQWYQATLQRDLANERLAQAVDISERMLFDIDEKLVGVAGAGELRRTLTYNALSFLIELRQQAADSEDVEWAQMVAYYQKGNLALRYGDLDEAEIAFTKSQEIAKNMVDKQPGYIEPYHSWALSYHALGKVKAKQNLYSEAYDAFDHAKQLADFILEDKVDDEDTLLLLINIYQDWGDVAYKRRDIAVAHKNYSAGIKLIQQLTQKYPDDAEYWYLYTLMLDRKARYFPVHINPVKLLDIREESVDILKRLVSEFPDIAKYKLNLAISYEKMADIAFTTDNLDGAKNYYSYALATMQALFAAEPINNNYKNMLAVDYGNLGATYLRLGELNKALDLFEQEYAWMQALTRVDPTNQEYTFGYIIAKQHLGEYYSRIKESSKSIEYYQSAIKLTLSLLEKRGDVKRTHFLLAAIRNQLAELFVDTDFSQSTKLIQETVNDLEFWLQEHPNDNEGLLYLAQALTNNYLIAKRTGDTTAASQLQRKILSSLSHISKSNKVKFSKNIDEIIRKLNPSPKTIETLSNTE